MTTCATPLADAPVMRLTLAGGGEPLLRMEKRLSCAAGGAGVRLEIVICKDYDALGIALVDTPAVLYQGQVIFKGLPRNDVWLKQKF